MSEQPGWEWQSELERERHEMTVQALDRCAAAGAKPEDLKTLARECGIQNYEPRGNHAAHH
jgi:hypothetical protein